MAQEKREKRGYREERTKEEWMKSGSNFSGKLIILEYKLM